MIVPTIHMNGTPKDSLCGALEKATEKIRDAIAAVCATSPHGRDYYPQGDDAIRVAQDDHYDRLKKLTSVLDDLTDIRIRIEFPEVAGIVEEVFKAMEPRP